MESGFFAIILRAFKGKKTLEEERLQSNTATKTAFCRRMRLSA
ncbi:MAG: hypothetical protein ACRC8G_00640 [Plesiomonas shigelloides]